MRLDAWNASTLPLLATAGISTGVSTGFLHWRPAHGGTRRTPGTQCVAFRVRRANALMRDQKAHVSRAIMKFSWEAGFWAAPTGKRITFA